MTMGPPGHPEPPRSVLVVDDGPENRVLLGAVLERAGYRVTLAENGAQGLAAVEREPPDLIVLDYMMPRMDGAEVTRRLRAGERSREIPIIILTASRLDTHIEAAFTAGANDYVTKPVDRRILKARVESAIRAADDRRRVTRMVQSDREHGEILRELREASEVQQAQLPQLPLERDGWRITGGLLPGGLIGGDVFDVTPGLHGAQVLILIDVSGHGLAAALVAASVSSQLRALVRTHELTEALRLLNLQLARESLGASLRLGKYACIGAIELRRDRATVINAGLPPICLVRDGACADRIEASGFPPGLLDDADYERYELPVHPGERLVLMSDGLTEPFGRADEVTPCLDRLGLLDTAQQAPAPEPLVARMEQLLRATGARDRDDATLLVAELGGASRPQGDTP
ncbi:MAG TPA: fused response regulator/phosphatase [Polyangia bacterium]|jgi:sigma-B regulation protein RsbU (phosphoserine phosphatase)|nr:fused response regulator/phosphatase [Polyangia bacterium]